MGFNTVIELRGKQAEVGVSKLIRNDGTEVFLIEIEGVDLKRLGFDLGRFDDKGELGGCK